MGLQHHVEFQKKTNELIPIKILDGRTEGQKDGQTIIRRTLSTTAKVPKRTFEEHELVYFL